MIRLFCLSLVVCLFVSCSAGSNHGDLRAYVEEVKSKPAGKIDPIPTYPPFEAFLYSSAAIRSPFDKPVDIQQRVVRQSNSNVKPDANRSKEYLESFGFDSLSMVGTLKQRGTTWALMKDSEGRIHRVTTGNYIGKNHGKIMTLNESKLEVMEIVSDGLDGWVEKPRTKQLSEKE